MISDKDLWMVETHPEIEIGHGQGEETEGIEVMIDNTEVGTEVEIIIEILETIGIETIGTLDQTEVIDQEAIIEKDIMVTIIEGLTIVLDVTAIKVAIILRDLRIEITLMAEGTLEEILHVLMIVYVKQLRSGEDPELQNTLKNASYRGGRAANCFNYSPTEGDGGLRAIRSSPG